MNKSQAYDTFWNSFGWEAYDEYTTPDKNDLPEYYITYNFASDSLDSDVMLHVYLWDSNTASWARVAQKVEEISQRIEQMRTPLQLDAGYLWIKKGSPFAQRINDNTDDMVRGYYLNITVEFLTAY